MKYITPDVPNITLIGVDKYEIDFIQSVDIINLNDNDNLLMITVPLNSDELNKLQVNANLDYIMLDFEMKNVMGNSIGISGIEIKNSRLIQKISNFKSGCHELHTYVFYNGDCKNINNDVLSIIRNYKINNELEKVISETKIILGLLNSFRNSDILKEHFENQLNKWNGIVKKYNKKEDEIDGDE